MNKKQEKKYSNKQAANTQNASQFPHWPHSNAI